MKSKATYKTKIICMSGIFITTLIFSILVLLSCTKGDNTAGKSAMPAPPPAALASTGQQADEPLRVAEVMPRFPGGDRELINYISMNIKYPEDAVKEGIQGKVIVRFCINSGGGVDRISVVSGVDPALDKEAIRVVSTLPEFEPAMQDGKKVPVWYMLPITFALK